MSHKKKKHKSMSKRVTIKRKTVRMVKLKTIIRDDKHLCLEGRYASEQN